MKLSLISALTLVACSAASRLATQSVRIFTLLDYTTPQLQKLYGPAADGACRCYQSGSTYARFCEDADDAQHRMTLVAFADTAACSQPAKARHTLPVVVTPGGVSVGDTEELLLEREGTAANAVKPADVRRASEGPFSAEETQRFGDVMYEFSRPDQPVLTVFVRQGRVSAIAAWISESE